ncbi:hypothetical protein [Crenobacter intestini]|uniref:Uncharacterized protein n=1 Tax=Crenobacter intestini TaxID=2563443 RepID=A0A4V4N7G7_9NEIS|nr:hypothetical protein [Crenobacter intestini]TIC80553.1 hypothetical protein E5K04_12020 [Crenobacter intestini]
MARKQKPASPQNGEAAARAAAQQRHARAQAACQAVLAAFDALEAADGFTGHDTARQYAQMCRVYAAKLRNGNVLSSADFDVAVKLCTAARRALLQLDPALAFAGQPGADALIAAGAAAYTVLEDNHKLGGPASKRPLPF